MLLDLYGAQEVAAERPTVVTYTNFIGNNRGTRLEVIEELDEEATDAALAAAKNPDELAAAIAALPRPAKPEPKSAAAPAKKGK